jgi:hypothetical protein
MHAISLFQIGWKGKRKIGREEGRQREREN